MKNQITCLVITGMRMKLHLTKQHYYLVASHLFHGINAVSSL